MTMMKIFRMLFVAVALVSTHWMGMSMAREFETPVEVQAAAVAAAEDTELVSARAELGPLPEVVAR